MLHYTQSVERLRLLTVVVVILGLGFRFRFCESCGSQQEQGGRGGQRGPPQGVGEPPHGAAATQRRRRGGTLLLGGPVTPSGRGCQPICTEPGPRPHCSACCDHHPSPLALRPRPAPPLPRRPTSPIRQFSINFQRVCSYLQFLIIVSTNNA